MAVSLINPYRHGGGGGGTPPPADSCVIDITEDSTVLSAGGMSFECYDVGTVSNDTLLVKGNGWTTIYSGGDDLGVIGLESFEDYVSESSGLFYEQSAVGDSVTGFDAFYLTTQESGIHYEALVTIASGTVGSDLTDFPFALTLSDMPDGFWENVDSSGGDIRAFDSNGTRLPIDLVYIDTFARVGSIFIKCDIASASDTDLRIQVGNGGSQAPIDDAYGQWAVWSDFEVVMMGNKYNHFEDRTGNHVGGVNDFPDPGVIGEMPEAPTMSFPSTNTEWVDFTGLPTFTNFTMGGTASFVNTSSNRVISSYRNLAAGATNKRAIMGARSSDYIDFWDSSNSWLNYTPPTNSNNKTYWRIHLRHQGSTSRTGFVDGVGYTDSPITDLAAAASPDCYTIGREDDSGSEDMYGTLAYCYLRGEALSDDWIAAEAANLSNDPSDPFYTVIDYVT